MLDLSQSQENHRLIFHRQVADVPRDLVQRISKPELKIVEKRIDIPGETVPTTKPYLIENKIVIPRYTTKEVPTVVAQRLVPVLAESDTDFVNVDLKEFNPYLVPVDVYVPRPVSRQVIATSQSEEHRVIDVPVGQFNTLLRQLNTHCTQQDIERLLVKDSASGAIPQMPSVAGSFYVPPHTASCQTEDKQETLHYSPKASATDLTIPSAANTAMASVGTIPAKFATQNSDDDDDDKTTAHFLYRPQHVSYSAGTESPLVNPPSASTAH